MNNTKPCVKITLTDTKPSIFESKIGGLGYIPHDKNFPTDSNGNQLRLLAQIECDKIQLDGFMNKGLLQFWISNDDNCGMDWDNQTNQDGFRIIYYPETDKSVTKEEIENKFIKNQYDDDEYNEFPVFRECGMSFEKSENGYIDCHKNEYGVEYEEYDDSYSGHKVGGYPFFTQSDPRDDKMLEYYDFLLFQLDTDYIGKEDVTMWGDCGVGNFFINSEKLKNKDFSDVLYNWDCC
ncbi:MAG: YwqG family protein [Ruminococcus flavefaciens]|nr:YwqG family protein [Ruminococcus flavefaciens]